MDETEYHAHPALSYSTGKEYLRSPAHYKEAVENRVEKAEYDYGHAAHKYVLGKGGEIVEIPAEVLSKSGSVGTDAARAFLAKARAAGQVPLKAHEIAAAKQLADAVREDPDARSLLDQPGRAEVSLFATDPETGVEIRGRLDWLPDPRKGHRVFPVDLKTTSDASPLKVRKTLDDFDYDLQAAWYLHLLRLAGRDDMGPFCFIFAEKTRPHGVFTIQVSHEDWLTGGEVKLRHVLRRHAACLESGRWPNYPPGIHAIEPPGWYLDRLDRLDLEDAS